MYIYIYIHTCVYCLYMYMYMYVYALCYRSTSRAGRGCLTWASAAISASCPVPRRLPRPWTSWRSVPKDRGEADEALRDGGKRLSWPQAGWGREWLEPFERERHNYYYYYYHYHYYYYHY